MKKKVRIGLLALFVVIFAVSAVMMARQGMQYQKNEELQKSAREVAELPLAKPGLESLAELDPHAAVLAEIDLEALQEINSDVIGWISIPDTQMSYPVLQGEDNHYYLDHAWNKEYNAAGSVFLESTNSADLSDYHTLVYGHRMRNGSMFGMLRDYDKLDFWQEHPSVYLVTEDYVYRYDIFAAYQAGVREIVYWLDLTGREEALIQYCLEHTVLDTGITPSPEERLLTMSTCTGNGYEKRWVVQGVLRGEYGR